MDDPIDAGDEVYLDAVGGPVTTEALDRDVEAREARDRRCESNLFESLPLHRLLAYGRDHGPDVDGLAEAVGRSLTDELLEEGLSDEQERTAIRTLGERVLSDHRLLALAPWPEHERTGQSPPVAGSMTDLLDDLARRLTEGLPLARRVRYTRSDGDTVTSGVRACRDSAIDEVARRVVDAYEKMEAKQTWLWSLPRDTPGYLQPREAMRAGQTLADPALRDLIERGWDATVADHLTRKANSHPASREDYRDRWSDAAIDGERLRSIKVKIGERFLGRAGVAPPDGLRLAKHEGFLESVGDALLEAVYGEGCARIRDFDRLWDLSEWGALVARGFITPEEGEGMRMWAERDYRRLLAAGHITEGDCEWYERMDAIASGLP